MTTTTTTTAQRNGSECQERWIFYHICSDHHHDAFARPKIHGKACRHGELHVPQTFWTGMLKIFFLSSPILWWHSRLIILLVAQCYRIITHNIYIWFHTMDPKTHTHSHTRTDRQNSAQAVCMIRINMCNVCEANISLFQRQPKWWAKIRNLKNASMKICGRRYFVFFSLLLFVCLCTTHRLSSFSMLWLSF